MKFNELCNKILNEGHLEKGTEVTITAPPEELGPKFPFKTGDKVKINRFMGWQGHEEEYEVKKGSKRAILTNLMFESEEDSYA
jgi:hypothetical protein